jgi:hypothetical protein
MSSRLCAVCGVIFKGPLVLREDRPHHRAEKDVQDAADQGCYICSIVIKSEEWQTIGDYAPFKAVWHLSDMTNASDESLKLTIDMMGDVIGGDGTSEIDVQSSSDSEPDNKKACLPDRESESGDDASLLDTKTPLWGFMLCPLVGKSVACSLQCSTESC